MDIPEELNAIKGKLPLSSIITGFVGLAYITGYLISALYLRHRGISPLPLLKAQYIETGLAFLIVTSILVGIPFLIIHMAYSDIDSNRRWKSLRISTAALITTNYLLVIAVVVIFIENEWRSSTSLWGINLGFQTPIILYLSLIIILLIVPRILLGGQNKRTNDALGLISIILTKLRSHLAKSEYVKNSVILICRLFAIILTMFTDYFILKSMPWLECFIKHIMMYLYATFFLVIAIGVVSWFAKGIDHKGLKVKTWIVGLPAFLLCYYLCIMTYSYRVFPNVPSSRGGKYPTSEARLHYVSSYMGANIIPSPLYIIEETDNILYVMGVKDCEWYYNDDKIYAVPTSKIDWIELTKPIYQEPRKRLCQLREP